MTETITRHMWLRLYKDLFRQAKLFNSYNYREYAKRRIRDSFRQNPQQQETDVSKFRSLYEKGHSNLESLKRQITVVNLYASKKLVIENLPPNSF